MFNAYQRSTIPTDQDDPRQLKQDRAAASGFPVATKARHGKDHEAVNDSAQSSPPPQSLGNH